MSQTAPITSIAPPEQRARAAIAQAAEKTGTDFDYLLAQAKLESSLNPNARARTSSATGLYQFINSTWLSVLDRHGEQFGYSRAAGAIQSVGGQARISDSSQTAEIMALRLDPHASALMAGALAQDNRAALLPVLGREPKPNELYLAHFLGAAGATRFLTELQNNPHASAAALMPKAASANRSIFYQSDGTARSLQGVYQLMENKVSAAMRDTSSGAAPIMAHNPANPAPRSQWLPSINTASSPLPAQSVQPAQRSMTDLLRNSFDLSDRNEGTSAQSHARRAYQRLGAFGL